MKEIHRLNIIDVHINILNTKSENKSPLYESGAGGYFILYIITPSPCLLQADSAPLPGSAGCTTFSMEGGNLSSFEFLPDGRQA